MPFNEKLIVGRVRRRLFRPPAIDGWLADERGTEPPKRASIALTKLTDGALGLRPPGERDLARLSARASELITGPQVRFAAIGWPEAMVLIRGEAALLYGEGDPVHFGRLALERGRWLERTGYAYLAETGVEVSVQLSLGSETAEREVMLGPGEIAHHGPYEIVHDRSYDPSDRPSGLKQHGYSLQVIRRAAVPPEPLPEDGTHPLDVETATEVARIARSLGYLRDEEVLLAEPDELAARIERHEGSRSKLEDLLCEVGPNPPVLRRLAEAVEITSPHLWRGGHGEPRVGRARITLYPTGEITVWRERAQAVPGRLRRQAGPGDDEPR